MTTFGQLCLLTAFVATGYAAFACFTAWRRQHLLLQRAGAAAGVVGVLALTLVSVILAAGLLTKDFRFAYVAQYSSRLLPWYYVLSAFWVGQAGSLLFWAWSVGMLAMVYRFWPRRTLSPLCEPAFAILMAYQCFLVAIMVFGADPMQPSLTVPGEGDGLSPLLQNPAMLLHPPVLFLGYAGSAVAFALAAAALLRPRKEINCSISKGTVPFSSDENRDSPQVIPLHALSGRRDAAWIREARPWTLFTWVALGIGILIGAYWAYEELGWGGYWGWDPVENGSLIPWLTVTALMHAAMACRRRGVLKRTTLLLAVATFAACNFAAFLTRSGIFSSLHAFSQSPIGWMFLILIVALAAGTTVLLVRRRAAMAPDNPISGLLAKEGVIAASVFTLIVLSAAVFLGTASLPVSQVVFPHKVLVGAGFYNGLLIPTGLLLLAAMVAAPLLRWGGSLEARQFKVLAIAAGAGAIMIALGWYGGLRRPLAMAVVGLAAMTAVTLPASWLLDARPSSSKTLWLDLLRALRNRRQTYAGYVMHLALACLAVGVAGSSLGTQQRDLTLCRGESIHWAGRDIRFVRLLQHRSPAKLVIQAELEVTSDGATPYTLLPTQEYHFLQKVWNSEVAIHSTWRGDFYTILHSGKGQERIQLTVVENPMMRWMWLSGWIVLASTLAWFWPAGKRAAAGERDQAVQREKNETCQRIAA